MGEKYFSSINPYCWKHNGGKEPHHGCPICAEDRMAERMTDAVIRAASKNRSGAKGGNDEA